jgi:hypothetical protein
MKPEDKFEAIKKLIGNPRSYLEETEVMVLSGLDPVTEAKVIQSALWRLCELYRKKFIEIMLILEERA